MWADDELDEDLVDRALLCARLSWAIAICSIFLASDLPMGLRYLQQVTHYGKLTSMRDKTSTGKLLLDRFSIPSKIVWTLFYLVGGSLTAFSLHVRPSFHLFLILIHIGRRMHECLFTTRFSARKMHPLQALAGLGFYVLLPSSLLLEALAGFGEVPPECPSYIWAMTKTTPRFCETVAERAVPVLLGSVAFVILSIFQHFIHCHLASLRGPATPAGPDGEYKMPTHWTFTWISSSPHYTAEICIYVAIALVEGGSTSAALVMIFTAVNLSVTALRTREWYKATFRRPNMAAWAVMPGVL